MGLAIEMWGLGLAGLGLVGLVTCGLCCGVIRWTRGEEGRGEERKEIIARLGIAGVGDRCFGFL